MISAWIWFVTVSYSARLLEVHLRSSFFHPLESNLAFQLEIRLLMDVIDRVFSSNYSQVGCKIRLRKRKQAEWVSGLLRSKFFGSCVDHGELRKNERNLFCIDCNLCFCKHCVTSPAHDCLHRLLQICKYVYHDVVRLHDIQKHLDCSLIQVSIFICLFIY